MNKTVDNYLIEGCGRCPLGATPDCKVHRWIPELELFRTIVLECGLTEECKWGAPCYTFQNKNVLMISALRDYCCISFFKGSLLSDNKSLLDKPGENSQAARLFKFTNIEQVKDIKDDIRAYIFEAIEVEKSGLKVNFKKKPEPIPEELEEKFEEDPYLRTAFEALTPGRQRGYIIYFSQPKQSKTRIARIEKAVPKILNGEGLHDKYKAMKK
ncbi:YdeI/OmpD-associated family protein [Fulvivirgaceae bacterium BMA10]|uniref:YdeI/OmpD-associated family protein n=1 Tax=Splendidivirga corallicola TaxID=3051826 RepID=A0ABT8KV28_9BACT|nr:YdeI/OmpD-associated family protein [Fulvivirgaceae bacterium BMA10]